MVMEKNFKKNLRETREMSLLCCRFPKYFCVVILSIENLKPKGFEYF